MMGENDEIDRATACVALAETFKLLGDPSRLCILLCCMNGPRSVGDIAAELTLSPSLVSKHLRLLRGSRLAAGVRSGKTVSYALADEHVRMLLVDMLEHTAEGLPTNSDEVLRLLHE
jgi:DNA-binding transcriptional ArsR family regulator